MNKIIKFAMFILLVLMTNTAFAWSYVADTKIVAIALWEEPVGYLYFKRTDNVWCYVPASDKNLYSLVLTLYASGKSAEVHCYDLAESPVVFEPAHKLHRIVAK